MTAVPLTLPMAAVPHDDGEDDDVVARLRAGDRDAVEATYVAHHAAIRGFARRLVGDASTAEDLVHDTFVALPKAIRRFRGEGSLRSFLIGVAVNHARRHIRAAMRRRRAMDKVAERVAAASGEVVDELARRRLAAKMWAALDELPDEQRVVFVLCEAEQRTSVEVAAIVGAPEGTVRTRLFHAKRKLREALEGEQ